MYLDQTIFLSGNLFPLLMTLQAAPANDIEVGQAAIRGRELRGSAIIIQFCDDRIHGKFFFLPAVNHMVARLGEFPFHMPFQSAPNLHQQFRHFAGTGSLGSVNLLRKM